MGTAGSAAVPIFFTSKAAMGPGLRSRSLKISRTSTQGWNLRLALDPDIEYIGGKGWHHTIYAVTALDRNTSLQPQSTARGI